MAGEKRGGAQAPGIELVPIRPDGDLEAAPGPLPAEAAGVIESTRALYAARVYLPPFIGYLAFEDGRCVGTCAFKSAPVEGRVEIAYYTFPAHEGRGVATRMARALVDIALAAPDASRITAQTRPVRSASTTILEKCGFALRATVDHSEDGTVWEWQWVGDAPDAP